MYVSFLGSNLGTVAGTAASGILIELTGQWDTVFYCFAGVAIVWSVFWSILIFERPSDHPYLSQSEQKYLNETIGDLSSKVPNRRFILSRGCCRLLELVD